MPKRPRKELEVAPTAVWEVLEAHRDEAVEILDFAIKFEEENPGMLELMELTMAARANKHAAAELLSSFKSSTGLAAIIAGSEVAEIRKSYRMGERLPPGAPAA